MWDGNEVWLLAGGGTLYFAFPLLYASSFSGFYLPLMIVLWLLICAASASSCACTSITTVWRSFFDGLFFVPARCSPSSSARRWPTSSAACPSVRTTTSSCRSGPTGASARHPGILDWYTVIGGVVALVALATHGALWLVLKAPGELEARARRAAPRLWIALLLITLISLPATIAVRPSALANYKAYPILFLIPALVVATLMGMLSFTKQRKPLAAFLSSCLYLVFMLVGAAAGLYPTLLPSSS